MPLDPPIMVDQNPQVLVFTNVCQVGATSGEMVSKNWFISEPFDADDIDRIESIQLFTNAHHQGWFSDPNTEMWSWFELAILRSATDTRPLLAVFSHSNERDADDFVDNNGPRFGRDHPLIKALKPGNVIGVRICAQYQAWRNIAKHGRLEIVYSHETPNKARESLKE
ncbi:hypothetical protein CVT26_003107 [Gymnopilus dilepis]|uniref:Uncharacterized protein n=1 Tax=Gymnopilus dilepis TaxID=231916 RepID=A0A409Y4R4_9AGAR|nr:hypothetical protein CVT26_003107 [Gymnopilus dilepis]